MTVTRTNPNTWKPLSKSEKSSELVKLVTGRFDTQINPDNFEIREERGYTELMSIDCSGGYCIGTKVGKVEKTQMARVRMELMKTRYKGLGLVVAEEFILYDAETAGFAWRRPE